MNITLEASPILHALTGVGRYTWELATRLPTHPEIENVAFLVRNQIISDVNTIVRMKNESKTFPLWSKPIRLASRFLKYQHVKYQCHNSLVHGPNYFLPRYVDEGIITVHDLSVFRYPETHPIERVKQFEENFSETLKRTRHIITDSEAMRREIIDVLSWLPQNISVVPLGVSSEFVPRHDNQEDFLNKYKLTANGYVLCVSTIEPRKNIDKLLNAYKMLPVTLRMQYPLILIGGIGWRTESIIVEIEKGISEGWLIRPGFVSDNELVSFYMHARLFVYPSAYEGFGLPVIEAMACGVPVVASDRTSLPEVTQGAALLVNPDDIFSLTASIERGLTDSDWRQIAIKNGLINASKYTWENCIDDTVEIYKIYG